MARIMKRTERRPEEVGERGCAEERAEEGGVGVEAVRALVEVEGRAEEK